MNKVQLQATLKLWTVRRNYRTKRLEALFKKKPSPSRDAAIKKIRKDLRTAKLKVAFYAGQLKDKYPPTLGERAYHIAGTMLGTVEEGGNNTGPEVDRIIEANGGVRGEPWCGDFVAFCYRLAGSKSVTRSWAGVRNFLQGIVGVKQIPLKDARMGDPVVYTFDHVGLFGHWSNGSGKQVPFEKATHLVAREGNTGTVGSLSDSKNGNDGVREKVRPISEVKAIVKVLR